MKVHVPLLAVLLLAGCSRAPEEARVTVKDAVITLPAVPGGMGAAYFTLETNQEGSRLNAMSSPSIRSIEMHETREQGGRSTMAPLTPGAAMFGPDAPLRFAPGGKHAMLRGVEPSVQIGGKVTLAFDVEPVGTITTEADVRGPGQAHAGH